MNPLICCPALWKLYLRNVQQSLKVLGRRKWATWQESSFCSKLRCASTFYLANWTSFLRCFKNGSKCTEPWVYITVSVWVKSASGYLLLAWYIFFCFDNTSLMFFFCLISVHLLLSNKKLFNVSQGTGFLQFPCRWNGCTVCTRESLKKRHQLLVFKCNCSWEMRGRNGD